MPKYIDWFIRKSQIARDLLELELFPNAKEIDESFGCFCACKEKLNLNLRDESILCIVVGDGHKPRTACTIVFNSFWSAISIDPALEKLKNSLKEKLKSVKRLLYYPNKIQEVNILPLNILNHYKTIIYIHPHSHALLTQTLKFHNKYFKHLNLKVWLISMPCCVSDNITVERYSYKDGNIHSMHNLLNIYPIQNVSLKEIIFNK